MELKSVKKIEITIPSFSNADLASLLFAACQKATYERAVRAAEAELTSLCYDLGMSVGEFASARGADTSGTPLSFLISQSCIGRERPSIEFRNGLNFDFKSPIIVACGEVSMNVMMRVPSLVEGSRQRMVTGINVDQRFIVDSETIDAAIRTGRTAKDLFSQSVLSDENLSNWHSIFGDDLDVSVEIMRRGGGNFDIHAIQYPPDE